MAKANQKARASSQGLKTFIALKESVERRRKARELNHSRDKQASRMYRLVKSVFHYGV